MSPMKTIVFTDMGTGEQTYYRTALWDQGEVWVNKDGEEQLVAEMPLSYVRGVIRFLQVRAFRLHWAAVMKFGEDLDGPLGPRGDMASYAAESEFDEICRMKPLDWLETTPLMEALRERLKESRWAHVER